MHSIKGFLEGPLVAALNYPWWECECEWLLAFLLALLWMNNFPMAYSTSHSKAAGIDSINEN